MIHSSEVSDISHHFANGLFDKRVTSYIKLDSAGFKLKDAAEKTMEFKRAFND